MNDYPTLPAVPDMERATLAAILLNRDALPPLVGMLQPAQFYDERNRWIYEAMLACYDRRDPPDLRTVANELRRMGRLDGITMPYLAGLMDVGIAASHVITYARLVIEAAERRGLIAAAGAIGALGFDESRPLSQVRSDAQQALDEALAQARETATWPLSELMDLKYETIQSATKTGIQTGFRDLDEMLGGLQKSDLLILAARPSTGKTSLALTITYNVAKSGARVLFFSLEMGWEQLTDRLISLDTGIDAHRMRLRQLRGEELDQVVDSMSRLSTLPLLIDDTPAITLAQMRAKILRQIAVHDGIDMIVVDYLGLMQHKAENRVREIGAISRGLKQLAREFNVPLLALSQLSRAVEGRTSHVPMLSDLRDSGDVEQDADVVMFIYREEMYERDTDKKGIAEVYISKHRNGPIGVVAMRFDAQTTKFDTLTYRSPDGY